MRFSAWLIASFVILVWGITFVNTRALLGDFSALEILVVRFALAWLALWTMKPRVFRGSGTNDKVLTIQSVAAERAIARRTSQFLEVLIR